MDKQNHHIPTRDDFTSTQKQSAPQTLNGQKPLAGLSLDLDNLWSYLKTHGDPNWQTFPSYINILIPRFLEILDQLDLKITFFIVGQDAALEKNRDALKLITQSGHEVGNHSFSHEPWLHLYSKDHIRTEINETEVHINNATGQKPIGFRGPGFSWSAELLQVLNENGYLYDASSLPTFLGPLARAYYFWKSNLSGSEKEKRKKLFGGFKDGLRPVRPHFLTLNSGKKMLEIPVTTIPLLRMPFHLSYLVYLCGYSRLLMSFYFKMALTLCRVTRTAPNFLLHPPDFLDISEVPGLAFFPGMKLDRNKKIEIFHYIISAIQKHFTPANMSTYANAIAGHTGLKSLKVPAVDKLDQRIE
jgi:peptidoglycan/xylan/chitin deacetylase (PgdA/CDA1 family)